MDTRRHGTDARFNLASCPPCYPDIVVTRMHERPYRENCYAMPLRLSKSPGHWKETPEMLVFEMGSETSTYPRVYAILA